ncbi:MAG: hypothetical protein K2Y05_10465 [Hyphomicrobiaceae bacterium]|nr:hypothetical protein [Hyphomicrobiaceae bacterium]
MPPTADDAAGADPDATPARREPMRMPDRDNPFAWRAKTKEGRRGAARLLEELTDEEVARYMDVARDQLNHEERLAWLKVALAATAAALVAYDLAHGYRNGITSWHVGVLGLAAVLGYWPWKVRAYRRLWMKHVAAAKAELARRRAEP